MINTRNTLKRRHFLQIAAGAVALAKAGTAYGAGGSGKAGATPLRGTAGPDGFGVTVDTGLSDRGQFMELMRKAVSEGQPLFLPPGQYSLSRLDLPDGLHITGVPGMSRIVFSGETYLMRGANLKRLWISNLVLDGQNRSLGPDAKGLFEAQNIADLKVENCLIVGSSKTGLHLEQCQAKIRQNRIGLAADYAVYAVEGSASTISDNDVADCGNGGILVHRWQKGEDGTAVRDNRISRIRADNGGTGPFGNAINVYQADNVSVSNNHISDSAFTAVRANAASNVQIVDNHCVNSGETAIYSEFGFEGTLIANNLIDGAANGISAVNFNEGGRLALINGNLVRNIRDQGPYVHDNVGFGFGIVAEADAVIASNVIENVARFGMLAGWGPYLRNVLVNANVVRRAQTGLAVSVVEEAGKAIITNNLFEAVPKGAIIGYRWHDAATTDLVDGTNSPTNVSISGNRKV